MAERVRRVRAADARLDELREDTAIRTRRVPDSELRKAIEASPAAFLEAMREENVQRREERLRELLRGAGR